MKRALLPLLLIGFLLNACGFLKPDGLKMITAPALNQLMAQQKVFLVDVHIPEQRHIPGTDAVVSFMDVEENIGAFPKDKKQPIYLYCESGPMGNWAARTLFDLGYDNLYNLEGGAHAWKKAGLPLK